MTPEAQANARRPANWRKSTYSADQTACVEVANGLTGAAVRDSQNRELGALAYGLAEWRAFLGTAKRDVG